MFKLEVDKVKKLITIHMNGFLKLEETVEIEKGLNEALKQIPTGESLLLIDLIGYKPASPEVVEALKKLQGVGISNCKRIASIVDSALVQMQVKRMASETDKDEKIKRFGSIEEGLKYLFG